MLYNKSLPVKCLTPPPPHHSTLFPKCQPHTKCLPDLPLVPLCASPSASLPVPPTDSSDSDLELSTVRHQPEGLDQLQAQTKFTRKELQSLYRGFKNVRPVSSLYRRCFAFYRLELYSVILFFFFSTFFSWAGVSQWNGGWGDIQDHLFSVLSPRRLDIKTISPPLSFLFIDCCTEIIKNIILNLSMCPILFHSCPVRFTVHSVWFDASKIRKMITPVMD